VTAAGVEDTSGAGWEERTPGVARRCRTGACPSIDVCGGEGVLDVERPGWFGGELAGPPTGRGGGGAAASGEAAAGPGCAGRGVGATAANRRTGARGAAEVIRPGLVARCTLTTGCSGSGVGSAARDSTGSGGMARSSGCGCPIRVESKPCITPPGASALTL